MKIDRKELYKNLDKTSKASKPDEGDDAEDEGAEERPGAMLRKALAAKDDAAIEAAIKACCEDMNE